MTVQLQQSVFGVTAAGDEAQLFTFENANGVTLSVTNYGAIIKSLIAPDKNGVLADIILGYDTLSEYEACKRFMGCTVGRYANRIANGRFSLEGADYQLETNPKGHHLHGGSEGFHKQLWSASVNTDNALPVVVFEHTSADGAGGYPGNVVCKVTFSLTENNEVEVGYYASTDKPTIMNLTNHSYFCLAGDQQSTENAILDHQLYLNCDTYLPTDDLGIPLSAPVSVAGTPMDFTTEKTIGERIDQPDQQLLNGRGYDHNWVVNRDNNDLALAARVSDPVSGRQLEVLTTQPGIQFYTGNNVDNLIGKAGMKYQYRGSLCLETQHFPDSPNNSSFPSTVITPDKPLYEKTLFQVSLIP